MSSSFPESESDTWQNRLEDAKARHGFWLSALELVGLFSCLLWIDVLASVARWIGQGFRDGK